MDKKLLILDLDETLVYATKRRLQVEHAAKVAEYFIYERPHLHPFLDYCFQHFKVAIWTASTRKYADLVVGHIFASRDEELEFLWARDRCTHKVNPNSWTYFMLKDLKKVKRRGYQLETILTVDDTPEKWSKQYGNFVRVEPFEGDLSDDELLQLIPFLTYLQTFDNVRVEKRGWRKRSDWRG